MRTSNFRAIKKQQYRSEVYVSSNPEKREKWRKLSKVKKKRVIKICALFNPSGVPKPVGVEKRPHSLF